jgi:hypothetical protein
MTPKMDRLLTHVFLVGNSFFWLPWGLICLIWPRAWAGDVLGPRAFSRPLEASHSFPSPFAGRRLHARGNGILRCREQSCTKRGT